ncbi:MAG: hypothetical protein JXB14_02580 [Candidatus Altiarchaeota archaeon]|nr:hypothetical protein [Candidatus Altiarchaeota archaeon]
MRDSISYMRFSGKCLKPPDFYGGKDLQQGDRVLLGLCIQHVSHNKLNPAEWTVSRIKEDGSPVNYDRVASVTEREGGVIVLHTRGGASYMLRELDRRNIRY